VNINGFPISLELEAWLRIDAEEWRKLMAPLIGVSPYMTAKSDRDAGDREKICLT